MKKKRSKKTGNAKSRGETDPSGRAIPDHEDEPTATENGGPAHPHDRLFKEVFSTVEAQQDLVRMALPDAITSRFRMDTVRDAGQEISTGRMDLLLTVETINGATEYVYVLVEHKSYRDAKVAVQLLGYVAGIMRKHEELPMPVVHPVVLYHGAKTWSALVRGLEQGKADVLVRQIRRRFGLSAEEEVIVRDCHDAERLDEAAEACVDPEAGKDEILALLM